MGEKTIWIQTSVNNIDEKTFPGRAYVTKDGEEVTEDTKQSVELTRKATKIDPKTGLFTYYDGSKVYFVKHPHVCQNRNEYLHGSGYITFNGNTLTWFDGVEHYADHVTFVKK